MGWPRSRHLPIAASPVSNGVSLAMLVLSAVAPVEKWRVAMATHGRAAKVSRVADGTHEAEPEPGRRAFLVGLTMALALPSCTRVTSGAAGPTSVTNFELVRRIRFDVPNFAHKLAWSHDGERVAAVSSTSA